MKAVPRQREIIDRRKLAAELDALPERHSDSTARRAALIDLMKSALAEGNAEIRRRFEADDASATSQSGQSDDAASPVAAGPVKESISVKANAEQTLRALTFLTDQLLRLLFEYALTHEYPAPNPTSGDRLAVVAVGGYGRREMAPQSDIDLLFLLPYKRTPHNEQISEYMLYALWDLGLKVGHATRSVDECLSMSRKDLTVRTGILEARFLCGDEALYANLRDRFQTEIVASTALEFVEQKLAERDARHNKLGDTRYVVEPNVKEGKGGLRDLQSLYWIAKYVYRVDTSAELVEKGILTKTEYRRFAKAQELLWAVRCHLHYLTGRPEEHLTFDLQSPIAARMGYTDHAGTSGVERFMKHFYISAKNVGDFTRILCAAIEAEHKRRPSIRMPKLGRRKTIEGFREEAGRLTVVDQDMFKKDPAAMIRLFHATHFADLDIHPSALRLVTQNLKRIDRTTRDDDAANEMFMEILTSESGQELTLKRMNEAGVMSRFLPEFGRVVGQMQHDMYHVYTVDEHTLRAIGILNRIERGDLADDHPLSTEVIGEILSRQVLYLAVLFHDIAKGRGGDHSVLGAEIALKTCPRLGLSDEDTETVAWLVRWHLAMSNTAFKRDLSDAKTITDFAELVQSRERLRLLLCLTVVDIRAVGPTVWNAWKASLLRELYHATDELLSGGLQASNRDTRVKAAQEELRANLSDWDDASFETHLGHGYPGYWLAFKPDILARHARQIRAAELSKQPLSIETQVDTSQGVTDVTVYAQDHPGLFSALAGAFSNCSANVVAARIFTTPHGMALDSFLLQDRSRKAFDRPADLARMSVAIERALEGLKGSRRPSTNAYVAERTKVFKVPPRVLIDNNASAAHTVIEINGRDRPGFLYDVTSGLFALGLQISSAQITTYGERAVDTFYVKDGFGMKITHDGKLDTIRKTLLDDLKARALTEEPDAQEAAE
jgi:[protein-PII] uridylyltransferase